MPFQVKIGRVDRLFELLLRDPKKSYYGTEIEPFIIGKADLLFPLDTAEVRLTSSGATDFGLKCFLTFQKVSVYDEKKKKHVTQTSSFKLSNLPELSIPGFNVVQLNEHGYSIQDDSGVEIYTIHQSLAGMAIVISAGGGESQPSPPPKNISNPLALQSELEHFASVIEAVVESIYMYQLNVCLLLHPDDRWSINLMDKIIKVTIYLHIQAPISNDKKLLPKKTEGSGDENTGNDEDNDEDDDEPTNSKNHVGNAPKPVNPKLLEWRLNDVGGIETQKGDCWQVIEFLKDPTRFNKLGARIPKGVLLEGPPGTGKTMLAKAIAAEAEVPFFAIKGSDFVEVYVGVGAARVRQLFKTAKKYAKKKKTSVIIFFDEIDAVAGRREGGGGGNQERENTLNELLGQLDGFEADSRIVVIAATNRPDILDPAITRPGRFNRRIVLPSPDLDAREAILQIHAKTRKMAENLDFKQIARITIGFSGADLEDLINEAAILAAIRNKEAIDEADITDAREKILLGPERKIKDMPELERRNTAWHEAGHTLLHEYYRPLTDPVQKVTIVPRPRALGLTIPQPVEDKYSFNKAQLLKKMCTLFGGRAAEILLSGEKNFTTGASRDIEMATSLAQNMVRRWGMSRELGPVNLGGDETHMYLGYRTGSSSNISPKTQENIDATIKDLCKKALKRAIKILKKQRKALDALAQALLEKETLDHDEIEKIMNEHLVKITWFDKLIGFFTGTNYSRPNK